MFVLVTVVCALLFVWGLWDVLVGLAMMAYGALMGLAWLLGRLRRDPGPTQRKGPVYDENGIPYL